MTNKIKIAIVATLQEEDFSWNLYFAISPMANSIKLNLASYFIWRNVSIIPYIIESQKAKFVNI